MSENLGLHTSSQTTVKPTMRILHRCITDLLAVDGIDTEACQELKEKLCVHIFNILVVGQFNRGKTTLINALIGEALLPMGVVPLTSVVTVLTYGEVPVVKVRFNDGECIESPPETLGEYVTESGNPHNVKEVREVEVSYPSPWLQDGVRIIDTPGIGSVYQHNSDIAYRYLPKADAMLFLLSADEPVSQAECDFLRDVRKYAGCIFFLLNKADHLSEDELQNALEFANETISEAMGRKSYIFPASVRQALEGELTGSKKLLNMSRLPQFFTALNNFLVKDKRNVQINSVIRNLQRLISQARLSKELEQTALSAPIAQIEGNIRAFEVKKCEVAIARDEYGVILSAEVKKLQQRVEEELNAFKNTLKHTISHGVENVYKESRTLPSRTLSAHLEQYVVTSIRNEFDIWKNTADEKLAGEFDRLCARFSDRINEIVDELYRFSADLFSIPFAAVRAESLRSTTSGFYYKFWSEPGSMKLFTSSLFLALPKFIGDRILLKKMQLYADDCVEVQSGRLRPDFAQRLEKGAVAFNREMIAKLDATALGIESAMAKGLDQRKGSEQEAVIKRTEINARLGTLAKISHELDRFSAEVSERNSITVAS